MTTSTVITDIETSSEPARHPAWCHRPTCPFIEHGWHLSYPMVVDPAFGDSASARIRLVQGAAVSGYPYSGQTLVELTVLLAPFDPSDAGDEYVLILNGECAVALGNMLTSAGRQANRSDGQQR